MQCRETEVEESEIGDRQGGGCRMEGRVGEAKATERPLGSCSRHTGAAVGGY